jgi:hypothetical protein
MRVDRRMSYKKWGAATAPTGKGLVMTTSRLLRASMVSVLLCSFSGFAFAQNADLQKQLEASFPLTKATADNSDVVTAGAVLVLQKDNLQMCRSNMPIPTRNFYKNGSINQGGLLSVLNKLGNASMGGGNDANTIRKFVAGEKFWVTKIQVENDGVTFTFLSDPFQDVRYESTLKFPYAKGQTPAAGQLLATIAEVIKTDGDTGGAGSEAPQQQAAAAEAPAAAQAAATKTIALGQTKDQVVRNFGQPTKVVQLGAKEIDYYTDMKVTFTNNKVTNVE